MYFFFCVLLQTTHVHGGFKILGLPQDHVILKDMTIMESFDSAVYGYEGATYMVSNVLCSGCMWGASVDSTSGILHNVVIQDCVMEGIWCLHHGILTLSGEHTSIHNNCAGPDPSHCHAICVESNTLIQLLCNGINDPLMCFDSSAVTIGGKGKIVVIDGTGTVLKVVYDGQYDV